MRGFFLAVIFSLIFQQKHLFAISAHFRYKIWTKIHL